MNKILALDIGGTTIKSAFFQNNKIIKEKIYQTNVITFKKDLINIINDEFWPKHKLVGIAIPGFLDHNQQIIVLSGNLKLKNWKIKEELELKLIDKQVFVINDANAASLGEMWQGAGNKYNNSIFYTIGTGIGGSIIIDNKLITGSNGFAGEFGHGGYFQNLKYCTCGLKNCLEPISSANGIIDLLKSNNLESNLKKAKQLFLKNDKKIIEVFKEALKPLVLHMSIMQSALNPEIIILGGGVSHFGPNLIKLLNQIINDYQHNFISKTCKIKIAKLANKAGVYGACYWVIQNIRNK